MSMSDGPYPWLNFGGFDLQPEGGSDSSIPEPPIFDPPMMDLMMDPIVDLSMDPIADLSMEPVVNAPKGPALDPMLDSMLNSMMMDVDLTTDPDSFIQVSPEVESVDDDVFIFPDDTQLA